MTHVENKVQLHYGMHLWIKVHPLEVAFGCIGFTSSSSPEVEAEFIVKPFFEGDTDPNQYKVICVPVESGKFGKERFYSSDLIKMIEDGTVKTTLMNCPCCKSNLVLTGQEYLKTLSEHISGQDASLKDEFKCSNADCLTHEYGASWNDYGEFYCEERMEDSLFYNDNHAPFGSYQRQSNVEIYKKGVRDETQLPSWVLFGLLKPVIKHDYVADKNGKVLKRSFHMEYWKKEDNHYIMFHPAKRTWKYLWKEFKRAISNYKEDGDVKNLKAAFEPSYNRAWVFRWFEKFVQITYRKEYELYKKLKEEKK